MSNPNQNTPAPVHPLLPCVAWVLDYLTIDRDGRTIAQDYIDATLGRTEDGDIDRRAVNDPAALMEELTALLRTRFQVDIIEESGASHDPVHIENLEDRERAFDVLDRAACFGPAAYAGEFLRLAPYVLRNVHPEDVA